MARIERGNTILIAMMLVMALSLMSLGLAKLLYRYANDAFDRKSSGFAETQAIAAAETGLNELMMVNYAASNSAPILPVPVPTTVTATFSQTVATRSITYQIDAPTQPSASVWRFKITGVVSGTGNPSWSPVRRIIQADIASGSFWKIKRYERL